jgi:3-oxoacyl-[acyl-carrier protein] reductase
MQGLTGKVALVTGGSSGLGEAIVYRLAREGVSVAVGGRDAEKTARVVSAAAAVAADAGHAAEFSAALGDVASVTDCERLVAETIARHGRLDILVNSAGVWLEKSILDTTEQDWERCVGICLKGTYFMCKYAIAYMAPRKSGVIVNIASDSGIHGEPGATLHTRMPSGPWSIASARVIMTTPALAAEYTAAPGSP